jgi:hypothetical protein
MHHFEKWYNQKLKEEMEWEDHVAQEVAEAKTAQESRVKAM